LFPYQLADLRMKGSVVVLLACDTALGKKMEGEGMMGFASSLFSAGASQLVLTIAEVDAQASSFFSQLYVQSRSGPESSFDGARLDACPTVVSKICPLV